MHNFQFLHMNRTFQLGVCTNPTVSPSCPSFLLYLIRVHLWSCSLISFACMPPTPGLYCDWVFDSVHLFNVTLLLMWPQCRVREPFQLHFFSLMCCAWVLFSLRIWNNICRVTSTKGLMTFVSTARHIYIYVYTYIYIYICNVHIEYHAFQHSHIIPGTRTISV